MCPAPRLIPSPLPERLVFLNTELSLRLSFPFFFRPHPPLLLFLSALHRSLWQICFSALCRAAAPIVKRFWVRGRRADGKDEMRASCSADLRSVSGLSLVPVGCYRARSVAEEIEVVQSVMTVSSCVYAHGFSGLPVLSADR